MGQKISMAVNLDSLPRDILIYISKWLDYRSVLNYMLTASRINCAIRRAFNDTKKKYLIDFPMTISGGKVNIQHYPNGYFEPFHLGGSGATNNFFIDLRGKFVNIFGKYFINNFIVDQYAVDTYLDGNIYVIAKIRTTNGIVDNGLVTVIIMDGREYQSMEIKVGFSGHKRVNIRRGKTENVPSKIFKNLSPEFIFHTFLVGPSFTESSIAVLCSYIHGDGYFSCKYEKFKYGIVGSSLYLVALALFAAKTKIKPMQIHTYISDTVSKISQNIMKTFTLDPSANKIETFERLFKRPVIEALKEISINVPHSD